MTEIPPQRRLIRYARGSSYGQTLESQLEQLRAAGCSSRNIYREKVTGARADRRELNRMLGKLAPGDVVTVTRIDRLARSTFDLFGIVKRIVDARAQFRSLAEPWADTGTSAGRLMLTVVCSLADVERDLVRSRTAEGRNRAKAKEDPWGGPLLSTRRSGRGPSRAACRARRCKNWRRATTSGYQPSAAPLAAHDPILIVLLCFVTAFSISKPSCAVLGCDAKPFSVFHQPVDQIRYLSAL
jgi:DNA invertase Pin-like site-specific DNA recombinase